MNAKPYTPETLAERRGCSAEKIRLMFHSGELPGFRLGKLIRIPAIEVERIECAASEQTNTISSYPIVESLPSRSDAARNAADFRLERMTRG